MKVALVTRFPVDPTAPTGGVESVSVILLGALKRLDNIELHVVTTDPACEGDSEESWDSVRIHRLPQPGRILTFALGTGRRRLKEYLRRLRPDVVHAHDVYGLMVKDLRLPRVLTIHGFIHADTLVSGKRFACARSSVWKFFETNAWANQPHIISISPYVRERLRGIAKGCIHDIENPIAEEFFHIQRSERKGRIFSAACISSRKNTLGLLRGFARLLGSGVRAELILAGQPEEPAYLEKVKRFVSEHALSDRVQLIGKIDREGVRRELATASVFALVSLEENAPLGIEEAMAGGVPVVASNRCGMPYMIRDGESGYLVDPTDPQDIANRLGKLLTDDELRRTMGAKSRAIAEDRFHPLTVAQRTYEVYLRAIRDHGHNHRSRRGA